MSRPAQCRRFCLCLALIALAAGTPGCRWWEKAREKEGDPDPAPKVVPSAKEKQLGKVVYVDPSRSFVLIRSPLSARFAAGTEFKAYGKTGKLTELKCSPERKRSFIVADIVSGVPVVEDKVFYVPAPPKPAPKPAAAESDPAPPLLLRSPDDLPVDPAAGTSLETGEDLF